MLRVCLCALIVAATLISGSESEAAIPVCISPVCTVGGPELGENPENSIMVRVGNVLYFTYRNDTPGQEHCWVQQISLPSMQLGRIDKVSETPDGMGYHYFPSILRDNPGQITVFTPVFTDPDNPPYRMGYGTSTIEPPYSLWTGSMWSAMGALPTNVPDGQSGPWINNCFGGVFFGDISGLHDPVSHVTHFVGEGSSAREYADQDCNSVPGGASRYYFRMPSGGGFDGPWYLVEATSGIPQGQVCYGGKQVFTKGDLRLGKTWVALQS